MLEGVRGEDWGSLGLERRRAFCPTMGSSKEQRVLVVWWASGQHRDMRFGCRSASSTAWSPQYTAPAIGFHPFSEQLLVHAVIRTARYQLLDGNAGEVLLMET